LRSKNTHEEGAPWRCKYYPRLERAALVAWLALAHLSTSLPLNFSTLGGALAVQWSLYLHKHFDGQLVNN
jgi:hypothetical protein